MMIKKYMGGPFRVYAAVTGSDSYNADDMLSTYTLGDTIIDSERISSRKPDICLTDCNPLQLSINRVT